MGKAFFAALVWLLLVFGVCAVVVVQAQEPSHTAFRYRLFFPEPLTCSPGDTYFNTTTHIHRLCDTPNHWVDEGGSGVGTGTVTSVALSLPASLFTVSGSPVTTAGTLTGTFITQTANLVFAGPASGSAAVPTFRALVTNDLPNTAVTPGSYTYTSLTVDAKGRLTAASNGTAPVTSVAGASPITSTGGTTPTIGCATCLTGASGGAGVTNVTGSSPIVSSGSATPDISCPNCLTASGGGAGVTGTGTTDRVVKYTNGASGVIGDSHILDTASIVTIGPTTTLIQLDSKIADIGDISHQGNGAEISVASGATPLFTFHNSGGTIFEVSGASGKFTKYAAAAPVNGQLFIGNTASGTWDTATLTAGSGISITNGAGAITIAASSTGGITSLNSQTGATQTFATGTAGTDFAISSASNVHTFNLPSASTANRGVVISGAQDIGGIKTFKRSGTAGTGGISLEKTSNTEAYVASEDDFPGLSLSDDACVSFTSTTNATSFNSNAGMCWGGTGVVQFAGGNGAGALSNLRAANVDVSTKAVTFEIANENATGTTLNKLAKLTGAPSKVIISSAGDTAGAVGIVVNSAGTTGSAQIAVIGQASCVFDGATTAGHFVGISTSVAGDCTDVGASFPTSGSEVIGKVLSTNGAGGTFSMELNTQDTWPSNNGVGPVRANSTTPSIPYLSATNVYSDSPLFREDANTIAQRNSTTGQSLKIYKTFTDASNYERLNLNVTGTTFTIATEAAGTGTNRNLKLQTPSGPWGIVIVDSTGAVLPAVDSNESLGNASTIWTTGFAQNWDATVGFIIHGFGKMKGDSSHDGFFTFEQSAAGKGGTIGSVPDSPAQVTANTNNYQPLNGIADDASLVQRWNTDARRTITGLANLNATGSFKVFYNVGSNDIVLSNQDGSSTAANRFLADSGGNIALAPGQGILSFYDNTTARHRLLQDHLTGSATLDFGNLVSIGCEDLTITVTGAASGDTVALGVPNGSVVNGTATFSAWVSSANTVTVRYCNLVSGDPASGTFNADVWHH